MSYIPQFEEKLSKKDQQFSLEEVSAITERIWGSEIIDPAGRFHDKFFHEICPIIRIAKHVGDSDTRIVFTGDSDRFDGLLLFGGEREQRIEMTVAIDGRNDALRLELVDERGYAPAFDDIEASGPRANRSFGENEPEAVTVSERDNKTFRLLNEALERKITKSALNKHYQDCWLGIVFVDYTEPENERKARRFDPLCRQLLSRGPQSYAPFTRVFVVGISRQYLFDSERMQSAAGDSHRE